MSGYQMHYYICFMFSRLWFTVTSGSDRGKNCCFYGHKRESMIERWSNTDDSRKINHGALKWNEKRFW